MGEPHDHAGDEKNITHRTEEQRKNQATDQYEDLHRGGFRFLCNKSKPALPWRC